MDMLSIAVIELVNESLVFQRWDRFGVDALRMLVFFIFIEFLNVNSRSTCLVQCFKIKEPTLLVVKHCLLYYLKFISTFTNMTPEK